MTLAILGGTFDPIHIGHLHAAEAGRSALNAAAARLVPAARPRHRGEPGAAVEHRWRMACLACEQRPGLAASNVEVVRDGPSYTVDTLAEFGSDEPLVWLIGDDAVADLSSWHKASELPALCHLLVFARPGGTPRHSLPRGFQRVDDIGELHARQSGRIHYLAAPMLDISSTGIRRAIAAGEDVGALLPEGVWDYIRRHGLYGAKASRREHEVRRSEHV